MAYKCICMNIYVHVYHYINFNSNRKQWIGYPGYVCCIKMSIDQPE